MIAKAASELEKSESLAVASTSYFPSFRAIPAGSTASSLNELPLVVRNLSADLKRAGLTQPIKGSDFSCSTSTMSTFWLGDSLELGSKSKVTVEASVQSVGTPQFMVVYGRSNRVLKTTVQQKTDRKWLLECTPTCIGSHTIRVCIFGRWIRESVPIFMVEGKLKDGDIVRRGPDSTTTTEDFLKSKGEDIKLATQYEIGKLIKASRTSIGKGSSYTYDVEISWGYDSAKPLVEKDSSRGLHTLDFQLSLRYEFLCDTF